MASSSTSTPTPRSYDVFISFRGEDTRKNFTDHLYTTLDAYGVHTFRDDEELEKGGDIALDLSRAIEESNIFVVIFSINYADSSWCLRELVKIVECTTQKRLTLLPIFYHVDPSDIRKQSGSYGVAFVKHETDADEKKMEMIRKWRTALNQAASLSGLHVTEQYETHVIKEITDDIIRRLNRKPLNVGKNIVGMNYHLGKLKSLMKVNELDKVHVVGIYGFGGIGKTTIAKAVYNDISSQFDGSCFLNNVRERSKDNTLQLQQELLHGILKGKSLKESNIDEGIEKIKRILRSKRVLVVFDDVDALKQLENLAEEHKWFGPGSRIIITTRHKHFLTQYKVQESYEVQTLPNEEAIELFSKWAFQQNLPNKIYKNLSYRVVDYAKGLPLALKVLGSFLFKKEINQWESALCKLKTIPHVDIQNVLKISYDGLDDVEKGIFLDIACFFKGEDKDFVSRILEEDFYAESGIRVLHDKCLIDISENKLDMHDLLQQMGWEIVRQEYPREPERRSRLWEYNDVYDVLTRDLGTKKIEGIFLNMFGSEPIQFTTKAFRMMNRLRLLKIHYSFAYDTAVTPMDVDPSQGYFCEMQDAEDFEFPFYELRYLHWDGYGSHSLPLNFHAKNLVELSLWSSKIRQLWEGKVHEKLKVINLSFSEHLTKLPDFTSVPNLEILNLEGCISLESLPGGFYKLQCLQILSCCSCSKVKRFPEIKGNMGKLRELNLSGTAITEVPPSIRHLNGLEDLDLGNCENIVSLPESICSLRSLKTLKLNKCSKLNRFPEIKGGHMENLRELDLNSTAIEELSSSIGHLKALEHMNLANCKNLVSLPDSLCNLTSLKILEVRGCSKLVKLPKDLGRLQFLEKLSLGYISCELPCLSGLCSLRYLDLSECNLTQGVIQTNNCLSTLEVLRMGNCKVMEVEILDSIFHLSSLKILDLGNCDLMEGEVSIDICHLSSLEELLLDGNNFSILTAGINQLSRLVGLDLSHCKKLPQIPELPSGLRLLHAHSSSGTLLSPSLLPLHPLINCFKSANQDFEYRRNTVEVHLGGSYYIGKGTCIVIDGSSRIPEWINMQEMGSEVTMELPENWYGNNELFGFALCCVYVPVDEESEDESENGSVHTVENESGDESELESGDGIETESENGSVHTVENESGDEFQNESDNEFGDESELESGDGITTELLPITSHFECALTIHGDQSKYVDHVSFHNDYDCHVDDNGGISDRVWVICYPKVAIDRRYHSNQWTHFMASFKGFYYFGSRTFKVKKCGIHPIYAQDFQ